MCDNSHEISMKDNDSYNLLSTVCQDQLTHGVGPMTNVSPHYRRGVGR